MGGGREETAAGAPCFDGDGGGNGFDHGVCMGLAGWVIVAYEVEFSSRCQLNFIDSVVYLSDTNTYFIDNTDITI